MTEAAAQRRMMAMVAFAKVAEREKIMDSLFSGHGYRAPTGSTGVAVGTTPRRMRDRRIATGTRPATATTTSASASPLTQSWMTRSASRCRTEPAVVRPCRGRGAGVVKPRPCRGRGAGVVKPRPYGGRGAGVVKPRPYGGRGAGVVKPRPYGGRGAGVVKPRPYRGRGAGVVKPRPYGGRGAGVVKPRPYRGRGAGVVKPRPYRGRGAEYRFRWLGQNIKRVGVTMEVGAESSGRCSPRVPPRNTASDDFCSERSAG